METMTLLILLAYANGSPELKESLRSFLAFYRENRDVLTSMMNGAPMSQTEPSKQQESRPSGKVGESADTRSVLEQYLNRL